MMFHREPSLPIDVAVMSCSNDHDESEEGDIDQYVETMLNLREDIKSGPISNIEKAQIKQKKYCDEQHGSLEVT